MKYLLDTNALLFVFSAPSKLSVRARRIVRGELDLSVSVVSFWEIAIKQTTGKLDLDMDIFALEELCKAEDIKILPLELAYFERIKKLPLIHRDPFDRIIIATAIEEELTLLTSDSEIVKYEGVKTLWQLTKED